MEKYNCRWCKDSYTIEDKRSDGATEYFCSQSCLDRAEDDEIRRMTDSYVSSLRGSNCSRCSGGGCPQCDSIYG